MSSAVINQVHFTPVDFVKKPWGHEVIWAVVPGEYVGKILTVEAGKSLSLQYHDHKTETMFLLEGKIILTHGTDEDNLVDTEMVAGDNMSATIPSKVLHRVTAVQYSQILEVSTAQPNWKTDVTRIVDAYGRKGTVTP